MKEFILLSIIFAAILLVNCDPGCPAGYSSWNNITCYRVYNNPLKSQPDAQSQCETEGGYLASVPDGFTNAFLNRLGIAAGAPSFWLGIECATDNVSSCINDDETPFGSYNHFAPGNPSDLGSCVWMSTQGNLAQNWYSFYCTQQFAFACEIDFDSECMPGYTKFHGFCYRVTPSAAETEAELECQKDCGHLVSMHFEKENQYVTELAIANTTGNTEIVRIGLMAEITNTGTTIDKWTDNSPLNYTKIGYNDTQIGLCYGLSLTDRIVPKSYWTSVNCDAPMTYVCKTAPGYCQNTQATVSPPTCSGPQHFRGIGEVYSPGYPGAYIRNSNCQYYITSPVGTAVQVYFTLQSLEGDASIQLFNDISDAKPFAVINAATPHNPNRTYKSTENQMTVIFVASSSSQAGKWELNFRPAVPTYPTFSLPTTAAPAPPATAGPGQ